MFGTLIICLPSAHQGGDLVLHHAGETKVFPTSAAPVRPSQCRPTMACWYSDVHHEVRPVTSGYRWVLTYNLAIPPNLDLPSAASLGPVCEIRRQLIQWLHPRDARKRPAKMYYRLSHDYTEDSIDRIGLRALKGVDRARVDALKEAAAGLGAQILVAVFEMKQMGETAYESPRRAWQRAEKVDWHEFIQSEAPEYAISRMVDLDGDAWLAEHEVEGGELTRYMLQGGAVFENAARWEGEYTGYTGNAVCQWGMAWC